MGKEYIDFTFIVERQAEVKGLRTHIAINGVTPPRAVSLEQEQRDIWKRIFDLYNQKSGYGRLLKLNALLEQNPEAVWEEAYQNPEAKRQKIKVRVGLKLIAWI